MRNMVRASAEVAVAERDNKIAQLTEHGEVHTIQFGGCRFFGARNRPSRSPAYTSCTSAWSCRAPSTFHWAKTLMCTIRIIL